MNARHIAVVSLSLCVAGSAQQWSSFRGPDGRGIAVDARLPKTFTKQHVRWRVKVGKGWSSPVLWGNRLYLTRAGSKPNARQVVCLDVSSKKELWSREEAFETYRMHRANHAASSTPALDKHGVYLLWPSGQKLMVHAFDHHGKPRWKRNLGVFKSRHGAGTSPVVYDDMLIVTNDNIAPKSFLVALDCKTGKPRWQIERRSTKRRTSYGIPVVHRPGGGKPQLLFASTAHGLTAVAPTTGKVLWELGTGFRERCVIAPAVAEDVAFFSAGTSGSGKEYAFVRMPVDAKSKPKKVFEMDRAIPYVPTPIGVGRALYIFADGGIVSRFDVRTGKMTWRKRVDGSFYSSPVCCGDTLYIIDRDGVMFSLAATPEFKVLGTFDFESKVQATPAIVGDRMYVRTEERLWCLSASKSRVVEAAAPSSRPSRGVR